MEGGGSAGVGLSSRLRLLKPLIDEFGLKVDGVATGLASGLNVDEVMEVVLPAFEDRHLDVRSAATEVRDNTVWLVGVLATSIRR